MKKSFLLCSVSMILAINAFADFHVVKQNGGPNGYSRVEQTTSNGNTDLSCQNPGYDKCTAVDPPNPAPNDPKAGIVNNIIEIVDDQISDGTVSGHTTYNGYIGSWSGTNVYNYVLTIKSL